MIRDDNAIHTVSDGQFYVVGIANCMTALSLVLNYTVVEEHTSFEPDLERCMLPEPRDRTLPV